MSTMHPAIDKWGMKKYSPNGELAEGSVFRIEQYTYYGGYCETCSYEEERVKVHVTEPGQDERKLDDYYTDLATIMREVLDATL